VAAGEGTEGESEPRVVLGQQLGGTGVESGRGSGKTDGSTSLVDSELFGELAGHKEEEGQVKEEEEGDQGDVDPQGRQEEEESDDEPGSQEDSNGASELAWVASVGRGDTEAGVKEACVGQPETTVTGESSRAKRVPSGKLPHSSGELSKTTNEASHTDDGVRDGDAPSRDVVHGEDESRGGKREETKRAWVAEGPERGNRILNIGVAGERTLSSTAALEAVGVGEGSLVVSDVVHGSNR